MRALLLLGLLCGLAGGEEGAAAPWRHRIAGALAGTEDPGVVLQAASQALDAAGAEGRDLADALHPLALGLQAGGLACADEAALGLGRVRLERGETLALVARRQAINADHLLLLNPGLDPRRVAVGHRLKVLDNRGGTLAILVKKSWFRCLLVRNLPGGRRVLAGCFPVGIGRPESPTPTGATTIAVRARDMEWRDPETGRVHPPGSPGNILGGYWLGLAHGAAAPQFRSIGLHGYTAEAPEAWLNRPSSHGCLRLRQDDIVIVHAVARTHMPVMVVE